MITLHDVLYATDQESKVRVVVHDPSTEGNSLELSRDVVYYGNAGTILWHLLALAGEELDYAASLSVRNENKDVVLQIDAVKAKLNTYGVLYETKDGFSRSSVMARNYSLAVKMSGESHDLTDGTKVWVRLEEGIG